MLSLGGRLSLVNSILTSVPTYWISIYKLLSWVSKAIDRTRPDFLWRGPDINMMGCKLVNWKRLCKHGDSAGRGILNPVEFNLPLLEKWWWKMLTEEHWRGSLVM